MTLATVQQPDTATGSGTAASNTFAGAPTQSNLIVFYVMAANNVTISADDVGMVEIGTGYDTFRRLSCFAKIAGASEPLSHSFTLSGSASYWVFATEYSTTDAFADLATAQFSIAFDSTGSASAVSTGLTTDSGSLEVAAGYMAGSTDGNQQITTGFSDFEQPDAPGTGRRAAQANRTSAGGSVTATYGTVDTSTDNRLAIALAEFKVTAPAATEATDTINHVAGAGRTVKTVSGLSGSLTSKDWAYHFAGIANGDQVEYATADESIAVPNADGTNTNVSAGTMTIKAIDATDGVVSTLNYTNLPEVTSDTEAPTISINAGTDTITVGDTWVDAGATVTDNVDATTTIYADVDTVNGQPVGTYQLTYNHTDVAGNAAVQQTRTVTVVDSGNGQVITIDSTPRGAARVAEPVVESIIH